MNYTLNEIAGICGGKLVHPAHCQQSIEQLVIDTRKMISEQRALFIALKGKRNSGIFAVQEAYESGIRNFLINQSEVHLLDLSLFPKAGFLMCDNTLIALQKLATHHRQQFNYPVIGITGSNGKTIVKEWLFHILHQQLTIVRSPKSYNSQIGVPLSVLLMQANAQLGIFEAGISEPNEMEALANVIAPEIGIFSYLGEAHQAGFENKAQKVSEKFKLFKSCKYIVAGIDQEGIVAEIESIEHKPIVITWSKQNKAANFQFEIHKNKQSSRILAHKQQLEIEIPFTDEASIWNACTCLATVLGLHAVYNWNFKQILARFIDLPALDMRLQLIEGSGQNMLINDSYSADLDSLKIALDFLHQHQGGLNSICIISDFVDSGKSIAKLNQEIAELMVQKQIGTLIGVGPSIAEHKALFPPNALFFEQTEQLLEYLKHTHFYHSIILVKGARSFEFEKICRQLAKQIHQTAFEINLNALVNNLNTYRNLLKPGVQTMGMVKAFSYGTGSIEIARTLAHHQIDYLTVAYTDEGVILRNAGIKTPMMVMNAEPSSFDTLFSHNLEPEIYQFELLNQLIQHANGAACGIHLELDTGMKRLGFDANQINELIQILKSNPSIRVQSVFTHLAASDEAIHDDFTLNQIAQFEDLSHKICEALPYKIRRHCVNSSGITRFPQAHFDMVRLGIGLYGIDPSEKVQKELQMIGSLKTIVSQIRTLEAGESVGYGRMGKVNQTTKIAIVAIGYADGLSRLLSNGNGSMLIHGKLAKIIGNVCMDMTMLDITEIPCQVGDEVIVFGHEPSIQEMAKQTHTIPYEILTGISQRVKRVYFSE